MTPRPYRNRNPGDLESGAPWLGLMPPQDMDAEQKAEPRFCVFVAPEWGFRALVILLHNYQRIFECETILDFIEKFAPRKENPTAIYAAHVARECGIGVALPYDLSAREAMFKLAKAIARFETGGWEPYWTDDQLNQGIQLTGLYPILPARVAA